MASTSAPAAIAFTQRGEFTLTATRSNVTYLVHTFTPCATPPEGGFPVLYCLDGNALFNSVCDLAAIIANPRKMHPDMRPVLIVAVGYPDRNTFHEAQRARDFTPAPTEAQAAASPHGFGHADDFMNFLESDLKPQVKERFPIDPQQQSIFGHSLGGLFVMQAYLRHPGTYSKYIAASPSVWFNDFELSALVRAWAATCADSADKVLPLMVTFGSLEGSGPSRRPMEETQRLRDAFVDTLTALSSAHPVWVYSHPAEHHITNLFASLPKAITFASCQSVAACHALLDLKLVASPV